MRPARSTRLKIVAIVAVCVRQASQAKEREKLRSFAALPRSRSTEIREPGARFANFVDL
jgi:hypothetical protein